MLYSGAYPHAECGDLQYALDGEHPREAHVHVLQRVLVRVALPMELQCMTLTNTRAERDGQTGVKQAYQFPARITAEIHAPADTLLPPLLSFSLFEGKESESRGEEGKAVDRANRPSSTHFCFLFSPLFF